MLCHCVEGAVKTQLEVDVTLERDKTKNTSYNLLCYKPTTLAWLNKCVMFKIRPSSLYSKVL